jgi:tetratricopeptide (TPR) repeat protein
VGKHDEAEPLYRAALAVRTATLGPDDPEVAVTAHNLGVCVGSLGRHAEALAFHKQALHSRESRAAALAGSAGGGSGGSGSGGGSNAAAVRAAGEVLVSHKAAAACLQRLGCGAEAEPHLVAILQAAREAAAAPPSPPGRACGRDAVLLKVAAAAEDLARCLAQQGAHARAEEAWWEALEARREVQGARHAAVLELEEQLTRCLEAQ